LNAIAAKHAANTDKIDNAKKAILEKNVKDAAFTASIMATPDVPEKKVSLASKPAPEEKSVVAKKLEAVTEKRIESRDKLEKEKLSK